MMSVSLSQDNWNSILMLLAEHPYKLTAPLIQAIVPQLQKQQEQPSNVVPMMNTTPGE